MKILVTGGKGAIGKKLMTKLAELGHEAVSYDILDGQDLFDVPALEQAIQKVDAVYHLAAEANLNYMRDIEGAHRGTVLNLGTTDNVAYLCAKYKKWMLYMSTMCVYGDVEVHPEREDVTLPNPSEIYAASKYAGEWIVRGYGKSLDLPYTILRIATPYGPGTRMAMAVHVFFKQALKGEPITVHGTGKQTRTMTYLEDVIEGCVAPLQHKDVALSQIFNISTTESTSALSMATQIKELTGTKSEIVFIPQRPHDTQSEEVDVSKAKRLLDWEAKTSFAEGLKKTLPWIKSQL
ncbi:MAG: NAD-dependent epimerase/dehydratase family protein [Minisyncoccia bacterium]|jgi:nucleoside-diphosphate-sugar epimerase